MTDRPHGSRWVTDHRARDTGTSEFFDNYPYGESRQSVRRSVPKASRTASK